MINQSRRSQTHGRQLPIAAVTLASLLVLPQHASAANSVTRWMEQAMQTVRERNIGTPDAGRLYAMVAAAIYDSVNGIDTARHHGFEPAIVPAAGAPVNGNCDAAVAAAAHAVLVGLVPARASILDAALAADIAALGASDKPVMYGQQWGEHVGQEVLSARSADGTQSPLVIPAGTEVGEHRAPFDARFRNMTPFGISGIAPYGSPPPPLLTSAAYAAAFNDVKIYGKQDGDEERNEIALFWLAEGGTARETGLWIQAVIAIAEQRGTVESLSHAARLFALVGMAIADCVAVVWDTKATYFTWRPAIAIREADLDGNPATERDATWTPRNTSIGASPEYNSGTSSFGGATSAVLEEFYGDTNIAFCFRTDLAPKPRCYSSALQAAEEAGRSRIYQGIHFQFANEDGRRIGRMIGQDVSASRLRRLKTTGPH
jgi:PAP2 superfamily